MLLVTTVLVFYIMLGDYNFNNNIIVPVDSLMGISLGMGLTITLKVKLPGQLWGTIAQWS